jgi:hypothetical protein
MMLSNYNFGKVHPPQEEVPLYGMPMPAAGRQKTHMADRRAKAVKLESSQHRSFAVHAAKVKEYLSQALQDIP